MLSSRTYHAVHRRRRTPVCPALRFFGSFSLSEARASARDVIAAAGHCPRCKHVLEERVVRMGTALFFDDDPRRLVQMFEADDCDACTLRLIAACIVLYGREREPLSARA